MINFKLKLNKKYYLSEEDDDFVIIREDKYCYYVVDSLGIALCEDQGIDPLFEVEKSYNNKEVEEKLVKYLKTIGVKI